MSVDIRIVDFFNYYHKKKISYPDLYQSGSDSVNVILPNNLLEYANAAAGHSGFGAGARARGIRRSGVSLDEIFATPETLEKFLESSEKNAEAYVQTIREKHINQQKASTNPKVSEVFWKQYNKDTLAEIVSRFGRDRVNKAYHSMTINEFQSEFGLAR